MRFTTNSPPGGFFPHLSRPLNATAPPPLQRPAHRTLIVAKRDRPAMMDGRRLTLPPPDVFRPGIFSRAAGGFFPLDENAAASSLQFK
jgi:hypothetical protein